MKRNKTSGPYSDPYTYGREQNFDSYTSNLDHLNGFRTAQDYASENAPGLGRTARRQVDGDKGVVLSPGIKKCIAVAVVIVLLAGIGFNGGFDRLMEGVNELVTWVITASLMTLVCWGFLCLLGKGRIYGQMRRYLFIGLFLVNILSVFIPGFSKLGISVVVVIAAILLLLRIF